MDATCFSLNAVVFVPFSLRSTMEETKPSSHSERSSVPRRALSLTIIMRMDVVMIVLDLEARSVDANERLKGLHLHAGMCYSRGYD